MKKIKIPKEKQIEGFYMMFNGVSFEMVGTPKDDTVYKITGFRECSDHIVIRISSDRKGYIPFSISFDGMMEKFTSKEWKYVKGFSAARKLLAYIDLGVTKI